MSNPFEPNGAEGLPPELAELDRELQSIRIEERASFGPELRTELARAFVHVQAESRFSRVTARRIAAAAIAAITLGTLAAPPARGGLVRFFTRIQNGPPDVASATEAVPTPDIDLSDPGLGAVPPLTTTEPVAPTRVVRLGAEPGDAGAVPAITFPELQNRGHVEVLVQSLYPKELQVDGVGGDVRLLLWVDSLGTVEEARVGGSSGIAALDRAALATAPYLRFEPARRQGMPVGSWVQFDVRFEPAPLAETLPDVAPLDQPAAPRVEAPELKPEWMITENPLGEPPAGSATQVDLLREAMGDAREVEERWGSLEGLLTGEAPATAMPLRWRDEAAKALEAAILRDPHNPAPFLALGRIRRRQGLRVDARRLFERGIDRAEALGADVPALVAADLYYERGVIVAEEWLPWMNLGQVNANALGSAPCPRAPQAAAGAGHVAADALIAWNYLCAAEFDAVMREGFESLESLKHGVRDEMLRSHYAAVEVHPAHPQANVALLLELADAGAFDEVLEGARRFALASGGHPHALLLTGLALHRMGRSEEAQTQFELAFQRLSPPEVAALRDLRPLFGKEAARGLAAADNREAAEMERRFWAPLDPLLATPVNERETEHIARATYAHLRFGGATTDPGRVWVRYGRPHAVRAVREGSGLRVSFWDYGPGPDITFRRPAGNLSYELTPEGHAYVEELMDVFPHRYDTGRGRTLPIVSQTARFRSGARGGLDIEVHARIPEALVGGEADSLELGLYLAGPGGERWVVTRKRIPGDARRIHLSAEPTATSDRVLLELYDAETNRAARLETPLSREGLFGAGPAISDLLLVEPVAPFRPEDGRRDSSMIEALVTPGIAAGQRVGVTFELYRVPGRVVEYRLAAEAEHLTTGAAQPVLLKPSGELEFREEWNRSRRAGEVVPEYVTLETSALDAGAYLLRVTATLADGTALAATRVIDVR